MDLLLDLLDCLASLSLQLQAEFANGIDQAYRLEDAAMASLSRDLLHQRNKLLVLYLLALLCLKLLNFLRVVDEFKDDLDQAADHLQL